MKKQKEILSLKKLAYNLDYVKLKMFLNKMSKAALASRYFESKSLSVCKVLDKKYPCFFCTYKKSTKIAKDQINDDASKDLIESQIIQENNLVTMKKSYEEVEVESFKGKSFSNLTELQRKIIQEGKFDLTHPEIKPKLASLNSIPGLQGKDQITEIQLGNIKIKDKNQVFLSEIDPYNIPQDYEIRFDEDKKLTIIGKRIEKTAGSKDLSIGSQSTEMPISLAESFSQKSLGEISQKYMGQIGYKYQFNRKRSFKELLLAIPVILFFLDPIVGTVEEVYECIKSIQVIEEEQMKEVKKIKKTSMINALLNNKDFNQLI